MASSSSSVSEQILPASLTAMRTSNPIRKIVDRLKPPKDCPKEMISLSIGDPTKYGNLKVHESVKATLANVIKSGRFNGYPHSCGYLGARKAVAAYCSCEGATLTGEDVILTSGCSGALDIAISGIANEGDEILLPSPGFSLYATICTSKGINFQYYNLLPDQNWRADVKHLNSLVNERTRAILVNNPSNPCGSVYSKQHLLEIIDVALQHNIPLIADEIYADMVFDADTNPFIPIASLSKQVPVIAVGGLAKRFLVPGWRLGWILIHDRQKRLIQVAAGLKNLTTLILGPNSLIQATLPQILTSTPPSFFENTMNMLKTHGEFLAKELAKIDGLEPIQPQGAMYLMVKVDLKACFAPAIEDDIDFAAKLFQEQNVCVLPGQVFGAKSFIRLVTCASMPVLRDACSRFKEFCDKYNRRQN